ncbi:MAG: ArnT family glycosyltransferase, partial [Ktedonobacterales bacterium]
MSVSTIAVATPLQITTRPRRLRLRTWLASPTCAVSLLLLAGASLRLWMLAHGDPTLDSDEATFGLMALHVQRGDWSVFMWGQPYMGTFETFIIAPFLAVFGSSAFALRLGPMLLGLAVIATTYLLAARIYSRRIGVYSAALLAVGSPFFVVHSLRAYGGYVETLLFGNLLLLLALPRTTTHVNRVGVAALAGLIAGLALWTDLLAVPYLIVAGMLCWWLRRATLRSRGGAALIVGVLAGAAPAIFYNVAHGAPTLDSVLALTVAGSHGRATAASLVGLLPRNIWLEITVSFPILLGGFLGGTQGTGLTIADYLQQAA